MADYDGWMIEMPDSRGIAHWYRGWVYDEEESLDAWTTDPNEAIKFVQERDAKRAARVLGLTSHIHKVTAHRWMDVRGDPAPEGKTDADRS